MTLLRAILDGFARLLVIWPEPMDAPRIGDLSDDWQAVGNDLRRAMGVVEKEIK